MSTPLLHYCTHQDIASGMLRTIFATNGVIPKDVITFEMFRLNLQLVAPKKIKSEDMAGNFNRLKSCEFSSVVSVKEFKEKIVGAIECDDIQRERTGLDKEKIASEMGISEDTMAELDEVCSPSNLKCPAEPKPNDYMDLSQSGANIDLATIQMVCVDKVRVDPFQERNYVTLSEKLKALKEKNTRDGAQPIDGVEVVLSVAFYHPAMLKRAQEFLCIGRQKLSELRDKIYCAADCIIPGEHSEHPEFTTVASAKEMCPSGFFFIEGVFYNDTRDALCRDYSKEIIDWVNKNERYKLPDLGVYTAKKMEETKFEDLSIKLGYPYLYCHQGSCEHLMIFRDLRILNVDDPQCAVNYPLQVFQHRPKSQRCTVCGIYSAKWLTRHDPLMSEDPSLFCEKCFKALHYKDGQRLYVFDAYQFAGEQFW